MEIEITRKFEVTEEDINHLMVAAFEGGINYWCGRVEIVDDPADKDCASEIIAHGGTLRLYDAETDDTWLMKRDNVLNGIKIMLEDERFFTSFDDLMENHDADTADAIVQYALFEEIVFG